MTLAPAKFLRASIERLLCTQTLASVSAMTDGAVQLAEFLRRNGLTQISAAGALGVSDPTIHDWVTGSKRPKAHHREVIAVWTRGEVTIDAWLTAQERAATQLVRPFVPSLSSGEHSATASPATGTDDGCSGR